MHLCKINRARSTVLSIGLSVLVSTSMAATYSLSQGGYTGGGTISGSFTGVDLDNDGQILSFLGEITNYNISFSGDSIVPNFNHNYSDLFGLVYNVGSGRIDDASNGFGVGVASNWLGTVGFDYASGYGPTGGIGGIVRDISTQATSVTGEFVTVSSVPEPGSIPLLLAGGLLLTLRFSGNRKRNA